MQELQPTSVRLTPELKEALKRLAKEDRRSLSSYIVIALEKHVAAQKSVRQASTK